MAKRKKISSKPVKPTKASKPRRDYSAEYQRRLQRAQLAGLTKGQARGHARAKKGEQGIRDLQDTIMGMAERGKRAKRSIIAFRERTGIDAKLFVELLVRRGMSKHDAYSTFFGSPP